MENTQAMEILISCTCYGFLCFAGVVVCATGALAWAFEQAANQEKYRGISLIILGAVFTLLCYLQLIYYVQEALGLG